MSGYNRNRGVPELYPRYIQSGCLKLTIGVRQLMKHVLLMLTFLTVLALLGLGFSLTPAEAALITGPAGGGQSHENHQPGFGINYLIATSGAFPPRDPNDAAPDGNRYLGEITMFAGNFAPEGWALTDGQLLSISSHNELFSVLGTNFGGDGRTTLALPDMRGRSAMSTGTGAGLTQRNIGQQVGVDDLTLSENQMPAHTHSMVSPINETDSTGGDQAHANMKPSLGINFYVPETDTNDLLLGSVRMGAFNYVPDDTLPADGQLVSISANNELFALFGTFYGGDGRTTFGVPNLSGRLVMHKGQGTGLTNRNLGNKVGVEQVALSESTMPSHNHPDPNGVGNTGGDQAHENMQPTNTLNYIIATEGIFPLHGAETTYDPNNSSQPLVGEIQLYGGAQLPQGFAFANGQLLPINDNQEMFSILGTNYGGDGRTNFGLPDLRSRVPVHVGGSNGGLRNWNLGERDGQESVALSLAELPSHTHNFIPEPTSLALLGLGSLMLLQHRRHWQQAG
jgi:microcystin-dependent protein